MSLLYIIDGYNLTNHPAFLRQVPKNTKDTKIILLELIKTRKLTGSPSNSVTIVFDGYPESGYRGPDKTGIEVLFSRQQTADEKIKSILEAYTNPKTVMVISDDKEVGFFAKSAGACWLKIDEFLSPIITPTERKEILLKPELSYSQIEKINQELKNLWLK